MEQFEQMLVYTKSFSTAYFFLIFCGIFVWTLRPKNRERLEEHRNIPLKED